MNPATSMAAALARVDELAAAMLAAVTKWQNCKAELDNTLPVAHALSKANTILIDVSQNYKAQADQFEDRAEDAERECTDLRREVEVLTAERDAALYARGYRCSTNTFGGFSVSGTPQQAYPDERAASLRLPMLTVVRRLTDIAADARVGALAADAEGDNARRKYLMGEHHGLMEAAEALLAFDWTAAWREACTIDTVEDLDALPVGSIVMAAWDPQPHHVMTRFSDGWYGWPSRDMPLYPLGSGLHGETALLVWHPDWDAAAQKHSGGS